MLQTSIALYVFPFVLPMFCHSSLFQLSEAVYSCANPAGVPFTSFHSALNFPFTIVNLYPFDL